MKKYEEIVNYIKNRIKDGTYKENDRLPSEDEICSMFNVSRMTANKALNILQDENLIRRVSGKGSYVSTFKYQSNLIGTKSFNEQMESLNVKPSKQLVDYRLFPSINLPVLKEKMKLQDDSMIHYITRIMLGNDIPIAISYSYISPKYLEYVDIKAIEGSLYEILKDNGAIFNHAITQMTAVLPPPEQMELLKIGNEAMLKGTTWLYDQDNDLIEYTEVYYIGSKYNYCIHLRGNGDAYE